MSVESTREVMERYWAAEHGDTSMMADDVVFTFMDTGEEHHGPAGILQMLEGFYHGRFEGTTEVRNDVIGDGHAVVEGVVVGRQLQDFAGYPARGQDVRMPICVWYDVADGRITRGRVYLGTGTLAG